MPAQIAEPGIIIDVVADDQKLDLRAGERVYYNRTTGTARVLRDLSPAAASLLSANASYLVGYSDARALLRLNIEQLNRIDSALAAPTNAASPMLTVTDGGNRPPRGRPRTKRTPLRVVAGGIKRRTGRRV